jgi:tripartite-type tricarboxylate transporter receptor subunit TctC
MNLGGCNQQFQKRRGTMVKNNWKSEFLVVVIVTLCLWIGPYASRAQDYPTRPITLIIQFVPGTTTDIVLRKLADVVSKELGQPVVPVNKPGGGGTIGVAEMAKSKPDGYTIGGINMPTLTMNPHMQALPYDPLKDITHLCAVLPYEYGLYVRGESPWKSFEEFVDYARKHRGKATYGTPGVGNTSHLLMVQLGKQLKIDWRHVPYKGDGEMMPAIMGGHLDSGVGSPAALMPNIRAGKLKLLTVTSKNRWPYLPEVPTLLEKGYNIYQSSYLSLGVASGTPEPIRQKLENTFKKVISDPSLKKEFNEKLFATLEYISGQDYKKFVEEQYVFYKDFLKAEGMIK